MKWMAKEIPTQFTDMDESKHKALKVTENELNIIPDGKGIGWFSDSKGSFFYREVSGNFYIETKVKVSRIDQSEQLPQAQFSSGGILVRSPQGEKNKENWIMYNIGYQHRFFGREIKVTRASEGFRLDLPYFLGLCSLSTLYLIPSTKVQWVKLRIARVNGEYRCFFWDEDCWKEEVPTKTMEVMGNGVKKKVSQFNNQMFRPNQLSLPDVVQVGIITNPGMKENNPWSIFRDAYSSFAYVTIEQINSFEECV